MSHSKDPQIDGYRFWISFYKIYLRLGTERRKCRFIEMICEYAFYGVEPDIDEEDEALVCAWEGIKPNIDSSVESVVNGRRGGRPPKKDQGESGKAREAEKGNPPFNPSSNQENGIEENRSETKSNDPFRYKCNEGHNLNYYQPGVYTCPVCHADYKIKAGKLYKTTA